MIGFVYILWNEYMPDLIKIGCTERSPHSRADELSKPTGVPAPFKVLCYAEFPDFQLVERNMHEWCKDHRVSPSREFFHGAVEFAVQLLWFHPSRLSFTDATAGRQWYGDSDLVKMVCHAKHEIYFDDLRDPWGDGAAEDERIARKKRYAEGDFGDEEEPVTLEVVPELAGAEPAAEPSIEPEAVPLRVVGGTAA